MMSIERNMCYNELWRAMVSGVLYQTRLVPGPADVAVAHAVWGYHLLHSLI